MLNVVSKLRHNIDHSDLQNTVKHVKIQTAISISDETFYTQSQIMVEKVPKFSSESFCLRQGMVTSGR